MLTRGRSESRPPLSLRRRLRCTVSSWVSSWRPRSAPPTRLRPPKAELRQGRAPAAATAAAAACDDTRAGCLGGAPLEPAPGHPARPPATGRWSARSAPCACLNQRFWRGMAQDRVRRTISPPPTSSTPASSTLPCCPGWACACPPVSPCRPSPSPAWCAARASAAARPRASESRTCAPSPTRRAPAPPPRPEEHRRKGHGMRGSCNAPSPLLRPPAVPHLNFDEVHDLGRLRVVLLQLEQAQLAVHPLHKRLDLVDVLVDTRTLLLWGNEREHVVRHKQGLLSKPGCTVTPCAACKNCHWSLSTPSLPSPSHLDP